MDPEGNPLGAYLRSLERLKASLPEDVLVLPGHRLPFIGLHVRADELIAHHEARCMAILEAFLLLCVPPFSLRLCVKVTATTFPSPHAVTYIEAVFAHRTSYAIAMAATAATVSLLMTRPRSV